MARADIIFETSTHRVEKRAVGSVLIHKPTGRDRYFQPGDDESTFLDGLQDCNNGDTWASYRKGDTYCSDYVQ